MNDSGQVINMFNTSKKTLPSFLILSIVTIILTTWAFQVQSDPTVKAPGTVRIIPNGSFTEVIMEFNDSTHREMWSMYTQKLLELFPSLEADYDARFANSMSPEAYYYRMHKLQYLIPQVPQEFRDEIEGMASNFSGGRENLPGDGKLSIDELYYVNLYIDIIMARGCSAISVFGPASVTGSNMIARLVDWYPRKDNAVFTIKNGDRSFVNIARLLSVMAGTAFNDDGVFVALLAAGPAPPVDFESVSYRSVVIDIRYALERYSTLEEMGEYLSNQKYTYSHQIFLADSKTSKVLENNLLEGGKRALRGADSELGERVDWEFDHAVAAVNTFFLKENYPGGGVDPRWTSIRRGLSSKLRDSGNGEVNQVTFSELKEIATYYDRNGRDAYPGSAIGDIYNSGTQHIVLFEPDTFHLEVFFRNASSSPINDPTFMTVPISLSPKHE